MNMKRIAYKSLIVGVLGGVLTLMTGCETTPQSKTQIEGAVTTYAVNGAEYRLKYVGEKFTTKEAARDILLKESAELSLKRAKRYFDLEIERDYWLHPGESLALEDRQSPQDVPVLEAKLRMADTPMAPYDAQAILARYVQSAP